MGLTTPFEQLYRRFGAEFDEYAGWSLPKQFEGVEKENSALYRNAAAFDLSSFGRVKISGSASGKLIDILFATDTSSLQRGRWMWGLICREDGNLVDIARLADLGEYFLLFCSPPRRAELFKLAAKCASDRDFKNVAIEDITEQTGMIGIYGPASADTVDQIVPFDIASMGRNTVKKVSLLMFSATVIHGSFLGLDGVEIFGGAKTCKLASGAIEKYIRPEQIIPAGMDCLELALVEASAPFGVVGRCPSHEIPYTAVLSNLVDFNKEFIGKKLIQQSDLAGSGQRLIGIKALQFQPDPEHAKIQYKGGKIGRCDKLMYSERFAGYIGLGYVGEKFASLDEDVQLVTQAGIFDARLIALPFDSDIAVSFYNQQSIKQK
ncbi:MAG: hypothetical protein ABIG61_04400 [Planctomycetota bacterium]